MRSFQCLLWLSGLGLLHAGCSATEGPVGSNDGGADASTLAESGSESGTLAESSIDSSALGEGGTESGALGEGGPESGALGEGGAAVACTSRSDCPPYEACGFPMVPACTAQGQCFEVPAIECLLYAAGCACDGSEINVACTGLPDGYATQPLLYTGPCADAGDDACGPDADCGPSESCGSFGSAACSAGGQCVQVAAAGVPCSRMEMLACACDGTNMTILCASELPAGYVYKSDRKSVV